MSNSSNLPGNYFWLLLASIRQALCSQKHLTLLVCSSSRLSRENLANLDVEGMDTEEETAPGTGLPGAGDYRKGSQKLSVT